jgi:hypothetical protein
MGKDILERMIRNNDYHHLVEVRAKDITDENKMIIEGRAVVFDDANVLFEYDGIEYKEIIAKGAFDDTDISKCFLKFNHSDTVMPMARVKNKTLNIEVRDDGVYITAEIANTQAGKDLFELVKRGDIDKMSFAFITGEEEYDANTHTWTIKSVKTLYDVAAVNVPAYDNTTLYARRFGDVEARQRDVEAKRLEQKRKENSFWLNIK